MLSRPVKAHPVVPPQRSHYPSGMHKQSQALITRESNVTTREAEVTRREAEVTRREAEILAGAPRGVVGAGPVGAVPAAVKVRTISQYRVG